MNISHIATKAAGIATAGMVLYAANDGGKKRASEAVKEGCADRMTYLYMNSRRLEDNNKVTSNLKDAYFRSQADWNLPDKFNAVKGYLGGFFEQTAMNIIPATLATGAIMASKKYSKVFGVGLLLYGIKYLLCDVIDVGRVNHLKSD